MTPQTPASPAPRAGRGGAGLLPDARTTTKESAVSDRRDTLEYWREIALRQAETLKKQAADIRTLIRERDDRVATMRTCEEHGKEIVHLAAIVDRLQDDNRRIDHSRSILHIGLNTVSHAFQSSAPPTPAETVKALEKLSARARRARDSKHGDV